MNDGAQVLNSVASFIRKFVVLSDAQCDAITLWVAHTYTIATSDIAVYLHIASAEKRCGKSRLLEVLQLLVAEAWLTGRTSVAALVRKLDADHATLLLDESDASFKSGDDYAEALRGVLNAGHRRDAKASLCVGSGAKMAVRDFAVFGPKAIAGIGELPDTITDRAIRIEMVRKTPTEPVARFRYRIARAESGPVRKGVQAWSRDASEQLDRAEPELPEALSDRGQDLWEPLLAIADVAGGGWPERAWSASLVLSGNAAEDDSLGVRLLRDIRTVFDDHPSGRIASVDLACGLGGIEESPWVGFRDKPFDARRLARKLNAFKIRPSTIRDGEDRFKGYRREQFEDAWSRYASMIVPFSGDIGDKPVTTGFFADSATVTNGSCHRSENAEKARKIGLVTDVTDVTAKREPPTQESATCAFHVGRPAQACERCGGLLATHHTGVGRSANGE